MRKLSTEEFIQKAIAVHKGRYDYSQVEYVNSATKVCIICPEHGAFWQKPNGHLNGKGCAKCAGALKKTTHLFIEESKKVHGEKYDYSVSEYKDAVTKVSIRCPIHGVFQQTPHQHLRGEGCPDCGGKKRHTLKQFIELSRNIHGNRYDYSNVNYVNSNTPVEISCPVHGPFLQRPNGHIQGSGCPKCGGTETLTKETFILRAREIHGWKYDYSKVQYVNLRTRVVIRCPLHGEFSQSPGAHLIGTGCPVCANMRKSESKLKTLDAFLDEARKIHGDKYDYSMVQYSGNNRKVTIICKEHGPFLQAPKTHLRGHGCPRCSGRGRTTEEFIKEAKVIHGDRYDYSQVQYQSCNSYVKIICPEHGLFQQTPHSHLGGAGCPVCGGVVMKTREEFIAQAKEIHGEYYDYSLVDYRGAHTKVSIICPIHGIFEQAPHSHLKGNGCPICKASLLEKEVHAMLTENGIPFNEEYYFPWLRWQGPMKLDFFLPEHKVAIECQGLQHFEPVDYFGGYEKFLETQARDKHKRDLCNSHGIRMLYYSKLDIQYPYHVYTDMATLMKSIIR